MSVMSGLSTAHKAVVVAVAVIGIAGSVALSRGYGDNGNAAAEAKRLTATFGALMEISRNPLQSLTTLFNGSGRVAAEEFTGTIDALRARSGPLFPSAMAFTTEAKPAGCDAEKGCWLVAYSTAEDGLLKPGADMSRLEPTAVAIASAVAEPNVVKLSPAMRESDGTQFSFLAVTIKNTRQFGVVFSVIDYTKIMKALADGWMPPGVSARIEASFPRQGGATPAAVVYGEAAAPAGTRATYSQDIVLDQAKFTLHWDFSNTYMSAHGGNAVLAAGILGSLLLALLVAMALSRPR